MMQPALPRDDLKALLAKLTDLDPTDVFWSVDPNPILSSLDNACLKLDITNESMLGVDEHRPHLSDGNDGYPAGTWWVEELGTREFIVTVRAETYNEGIEASDLIDAVRTGIRAADTRDNLNLLGLAFVWASKTIRTPYRVNERVVNCAVADFEFAGTARLVSKIIPPGAGGDYIATVNGNNQVPGDISE